MQTHRLAYGLLPHPAHPATDIDQVEARIIGHDDDWLRLRWRVEGAQSLIVPPFAGKGRADELWRTTCFEAFFRPEGGDGYVEVNLSPSERWAAYDFSSYREGMSERPFPREPVCTMRVGSSMAIFDAAIPTAGLQRTDMTMALSCVLEEAGGRISYWALDQTRDVPDFHDPACFTLQLAARRGA